MHRGHARRAERAAQASVMEIIPSLTKDTYATITATNAEGTSTTAYVSVDR
jgi:hypothetical protein